MVVARLKVADFDQEETLNFSFVEPPIENRYTLRNDCSSYVSVEEKSKI